MWLSLISSPLVKNLLGLLAIVAFILGIFMWGRSTGVSAGFDDGVKSQAATIATQKATITSLTNQINQQRQQEADKVQQIQQTATDETVHAAQQSTVQTVIRTKVVDHYIHDTPPTVASACAVDTTAVAAINSILDTQATYDNMDVAPPLNATPSTPDASTTPPSAPPTTQEVPK